MASYTHPTFDRRRLLAGALGIGVTAATGALAAPARAATGAGPGARGVRLRTRGTDLEIIGCGEWGARPPLEPVVVLDAPPQRIVVHHTATANVTDYSRQRALALSRAIQNYHMDTHGWIDTGQHFTVSRGAFVTEGRHASLEELEGGARMVRAAHCVGQNSSAIGIENEGTYMKVAPPAAQFAGLVALCAHICRQYGLSPAEIYGHRDFNQTDCPGDRLYALLPRLREEVAGQLGEAPQEPALQLADAAGRPPWTGPSEYVPDHVFERELRRAGLPGTGARRS
ncbi:peptidoglycan recognition family protein [Streptomyces sp. NPDC089919]|uniref:peptidoglycan recognition protein family protein n=1 Tax=Streptomyces sp. NPDC089919 TaxID=3155188 RepID=UPI003448E803